MTVASIVGWDRRTPTNNRKRSVLQPVGEERTLERVSGGPTELRSAALRLLLKVGGSRLKCRDLVPVESELKQDELGVLSMLRARCIQGSSGVSGSTGGRPLSVLG
jgi:hypothetical protein